ncbi:beta-ketoacyl synthase N-terminal-like domain-containing protein [Moheibacter sediminis]|uniref:3-oxoacyl-(Acyl-carrier-protein) synthase n=1 Tax=Moheibacter sediminis TaxID=1434700 RepID=A0A1W1YFS5_9FLAO|nr:beta-ketoacyl synthase N-terminal-like domain-containing protein [Moheibacter sediminis]SMC34671.1 3-oxoacyl-(acyl-carrier-protein) synthase [Moheibacter sediminis]
MMKEIYIYGSGTISIQPTFQENFFYDEISSYHENGIKAIDPDYKEFIPALQLRRMGKSMRMAVYASQKAIQQAGNPEIHAVITGTGEGCLRDSEKFVEALWENDGGMLNPTPFIQSTHNMAAATIALALNCKGYNMTYTNNSSSFESALIDGFLYLNESPKENVVIGGLDEVSEQTMKFWSKVNYTKTENVQIPTNLKDKNPGEIIAEGAGFYVASGEKRANCLGKIINTKTVYEVENPQEFISKFLNENNLKSEDLDAIILGNNTDSRYDGIYNSVSEKLFSEIPQIIFKNVLGEFDTATSLAVDVTLKIFKHQEIPRILNLNGKNKNAYNKILIYNQRREKNHSLILLER